jgi:hypothetical protein
VLEGDLSGERRCKMRFLTLALSLAAALVLVVPATAARPPTPTTTTPKFGTPLFVSTVSPDGIHRDTTLAVPFTHQGTVAIHETITVNGVFRDLGVCGSYRGTESETYTWRIPGTDGCWPPLPGDTVSYYLELLSSKGVVLDRLTTPTYLVT